MKKSRQTKQKEVISNICLNAPTAISIEEIYKLAKKEIETLNIATVYRNINHLIKDKKIIKIKHATKGALYEVNGKPTHHYFFCSECNTTFERPGCGMSTCIEEMKHKSSDGFIVKSHELFLHGICATCAA